MGWIMSVSMLKQSIARTKISQPIHHRIHNISKLNAQKAPCSRQVAVTNWTPMTFGAKRLGKRTHNHLHPYPRN
ncbi:hypothetical protein P691DRAFT_802634 [Macrolepiota fuliginosa MF-IS2]|uniref:Uncharacterized protein n=1 Tax=Macrolepiota fuliginosa MF-IS2 TaxID=1400762 RepID=A0A9P6C3H6_9AGAR|nr:hypothetical protein P691DRAFT_802634 [Macrolepiota fuliginosa MF-IS2]